MGSDKQTVMIKRTKLSLTDINSHVYIIFKNLILSVFDKETPFTGQIVKMEYYKENKLKKEAIKHENN